MSMETLRKYAALVWLPALALSCPAITSAQELIDGNGTAVVANTDEIPLLSASDLETLVGPIALYPDDLLAIVLPASTYPLQLVQAERFLQELQNDPELQPDDSWDDSIVALINYPEAVDLLADAHDKSWRLGEAVVAQQADVIAAIESFRDRAYDAGNLQSDTYQTVSQNEGVIEITPVEEDVIYVPYYEPERVVVYQPTPAYYYYPRPYPVYNYPYPYGYSFNYGFFWGVTTAFTVGWFSDSLHVYHHSYYGHPYYGRSYGYHNWYRQPSIHVHNNYYYNSHRNYHSGDRYGHGDYWRPRSRSTVSSHDQRVTRSRHYQGSKSNPGTSNDQFDVNFRQRSSSISNQSSSIKSTQSRSSEARTTKQFAANSTTKSQSTIKFRERPTSEPQRLASNRSSQPTRSSQPSSSVKQPTRSSQPTRTAKQPTRSSQPTRSVKQPTRSSQPSSSVKQPSRASQPSRSSQPSKSASQPSRSSQPSRASQPSRSSQSKKSGQSQRSSNRR